MALALGRVVLNINELAAVRQSSATGVSPPPLLFAHPKLAPTIAGLRTHALRLRRHLPFVIKTENPSRRPLRDPVSSGVSRSG